MGMDEGGIKMKVGINGFGRIGKAIFRNNLNKKYFNITEINDINTDNENIAYQLKYDSIYGTLPNDIKIDKDILLVDEKRIKLHHEKEVHKVPWNVDVVIDSSGDKTNVSNARKIKNIKKYVVTHSFPKTSIDKEIVLGINESTITKNDKIISSSICDTCAFAPVVNLLNKKYGIVYGVVTVLHPWLSYQNLLDGKPPFVRYPGYERGHYTLGRASTNSLIPKPTSCIIATERVLPWIKGKFTSLSFRVPTTTVSAADISVKLKKRELTKDKIQSLFREVEQKQSFNIFYNNYKPLISKDFEGMEYSVIIDQNWTKLNNNNFLKILIWYDNEWGYSNLVVELVKYIGGHSLE